LRIAGFPVGNTTHHRAVTDIDLRTLRLFVAACDCGSMKGAAARERIEPSAISKRIAQLEATLGTPLLLRNKRGVQPTPAGLALLEHARTVLFTIERIEHDASAFGRGIKGHVRLLATASAIAESLLDDLATFMREPENRNIKLDIEERYSKDLVRQLREGGASIGVCWNNIDLEGLEHRPYRHDRLALAVHAEHPLADRKSLRFEQTLDYEHVGLPPSTAVHIALQRAAARAGRSLIYRVIVSNFDAAFRVVGANLGVSVVPVEVSSPYAASRGIRVIPLSDAWAQRSFVVCFADHGALSPAAQRMVDYLVERSATAAAAGTDGAAAGPHGREGADHRP
jgi:DNA-binding transcriptional LysR family regulator